MTGELKSDVKNGVITYTTRGGNVLTSREYAEALTEAIELTKNQMDKTKDIRKKKRLSEKLRSIKLFLAMHPDVRSFMK
jgi:hypothetical protein